MRDSDDALAFGSLLRRHRLAAGLTQEMLAEHSGVAKRTLQDLESGATRPRRETARRLIAALRPPPDARAEIEAATSAPRRRPGQASPSRADTPARDDGRGTGQDTPEDLAAAARRRSVPKVLTSFVGRERELAETEQLVRTSRLVTLTGVGGCGKTRLALEIADRLAPSFPDGVFVVSLAALADPSLVASAVAHALSIDEVVGEPLPSTLARLVGDRGMLVVLDNFEHLLPGGPLLAGLLAACPHLTALVTSRVVLRLQGEQVYPVPPLHLPEPQRPSSDGEQLLSIVSASEAVRLFVDRARSAQPELRLDASNAPTVAEICRRLDGLPLAIELAAARARYLAPASLLVRLEHRLELLTGGARDLPARQQTLRATIAWSYDLLDEPEQRLFCRLGVFAGGFTLGVGSWVIGDGGADAPSSAPITHNPPPLTLDLVGSLVEKSLLHPLEAVEDEQRFWMLETIREFALERLEASGEAPTARRQHAMQLLALAEEAAPHLYRAEAVVWLDRLQAEHDNLRAALVWAAENDEDAMLGRLTGAVWRFWWMRGHFGEARGWLDRALNRATDPSSRITLLFGAGEMAFFQDEPETARDQWMEMVALGRSSGDRAAVSIGLARLAFVLRLLGDYEQAVAASQESLTLARQSGDDWCIVTALHGCAQVAVGQGDFDRAEAVWGETLRQCHEAGITMLVPHALRNLSHIAMLRGENGKAMTLCEEAYEIARQRDDKFAIRGAIVGFLRIGYRQGDDARVLAAAREALEFGREQGTPGVMVIALEGLAWVAGVRGDPIRAARLLGAAEAIQSASGPGITQPQPDLHEDAVAGARSALDEAAFAAAMAEGRSMNVEQAVAYARRTADAS